MKKSIKIDIHSISDVITNSSTDLFIVNSDTKLEVVKEILEELLELYNKKVGLENRLDSDYKPDVLSFEYAFEEMVDDHNLPYDISQDLQNLFNVSRHHI